MDYFVSLVSLPDSVILSDVHDEVKSSLDSPLEAQYVLKFQRANHSLVPLDKSVYLVQ